MPRLRPLAFLLGALGLLGRGAVADDVPPRPLVIGEAKLPAGFPPPGPVGQVITKTYPAHRLARTRTAAGRDDGMFMKLFRHIERNDIAMTAPVEMTLRGADEGERPAEAAMAFVYARPDIGTPGPDPADPAVVVEEVPETIVASLGVRGGYGERTFAAGLVEVRAWLTEHPEWREAGPPRALAYNSPFVPGILKYGEVQVPIAPAEPTSREPAAPEKSP
jgi:hypothetical protein